MPDGSPGRWYHFPLPPAADANVGFLEAPAARTRAISLSQQLVSAKAAGMGCPSSDGRAKVEALKMDSPKELFPEVCSRMARFQREVCAELTSQGRSLTCIVRSSQDQGQSSLQARCVCTGVLGTRASASSTAAEHSGRDGVGKEKSWRDALSSLPGKPGGRQHSPARRKRDLLRNPFSFWFGNKI